MALITLAAFAKLVGVKAPNLTHPAKPGGRIAQYVVRGPDGRALGIREEDVDAARRAYLERANMSYAPPDVVVSHAARLAALPSAAPAEDPAEWLAAHEAEEGAPPPAERPARAEPEDPSAHDGMELLEANRIEKIWKARLAELKFKEAAAELVPAVDVRRKLTERLAGLRTALLGIPSQVKQAIPALTTVEVAKIEALVVEALQDLVAEESAE